MEGGGRGEGAENIPSWDCSVASPIGRLAENPGSLARAAGRKLAVTLAPTVNTRNKRMAWFGCTLILRALQRSQAWPALRAFLRGKSSSASTGSGFVGVLSGMAAGERTRRSQWQLWWLLWGPRVGRALAAGARHMICVPAKVGAKSGQGRGKVGGVESIESHGVTTKGRWLLRYAVSRQRYRNTAAPIRVRGKISPSSQRWHIDRTRLAHD